MEKEAIYCNDISYLYFFPMTIIWRKAESGRGRFCLSAGCLSAWGEEEADKWEWVGVETEQERGRKDLPVI